MQIDIVKISWISSKADLNNLILQHFLKIMDDQVLMNQKPSNDFWLPWTAVEFSELDDFFEQVKPWKNEMIASTDFILGQYEGGWAKDEKALRETLKRDAEFALYVVKKHDNKDKDAEVKGSDKKKYKRYVCDFFLFDNYSFFIIEFIMLVTLSTF